MQSESERFIKNAPIEKIQKLIQKLKEDNDPELVELINYLISIIG